MPWLINNDAVNIKDFNIGSLVHLKNDDGLGFLLKGKITKVKSNDITVYIESVFSFDGNSSILSGTITEYCEKEYTFDSSIIHLIKKA